MKTKYLALLIAAMGSSLSFGASIDGLDAAYSKIPPSMTEPPAMR